MTLRLIHDPPRNGAENMAADEALLERVGAGASPPTLRLYQWDPPTISLGYFQKYADYEALPPPAGELDVVRRLTGGGAILHDRELTYSITLPLQHELLSEGPNRLYELAHDAVSASLQRLGIDAWRGCQSDGSSAARGPFFCFARRHCLDVLIGADKVAGSAQRRTRHAVLQHGSIVLDPRYGQQPAAGVPGADADRLAALFAEEFAERSGCTLQSAAWTDEETAATADLIPKYRGAWVRRT